MRKFVALLGLVLLTASAALAADTGREFAGSVRTIKGESFLLRNEQRIDLKLGDYVYQGDILCTKTDSSMGVIFRDDTMLSMGSDSEISVDSFVFDPGQGDVNFLMNMAQGSAQFITGQMAKVAPEKMVVQTPMATIGIRGTRFLVKVDK